MAAAAAAAGAAQESARRAKDWLREKAVAVGGAGKYDIWNGLIY